MPDYCSIADLQLRYGTTNLAQWSNMTGSDSPTLQAQRQQDACDKAAAQINTLLIRGGYAVPLQFLDVYAQSFINDIAIDIAVYILYKARGLNDEDKDAAKMEAARNKAMGEIMKIRAGSNQINCARRWGDNPTSPTVV